MWAAWQKVKTTHKLASDDLDLEDSIAAWCVDGVVLWFGITIENALQERVNVGTEKQPKYEQRYQLAQLLDAKFTLPKPVPTSKKASDPNADGFKMLMSMAGNQRSNVKLFKAITPS